MKTPRFHLNPILAATLSAAALLSACGGDDNTSTPAVQTVTLDGVAAVGRAFTGATVSVTDSTGKTVTAPAKVGADGKYSVDVTGLVAPLVVSAKGMIGDAEVTLVSAVVAALPASGSITITVSPLTNALAAMLAPSGNPATLTPANVTATALAAKLDVLRAAIAAALTSAGLDATTFNPITATVTVGSGTGADKVIETVKVTPVEGGVTLRDALGSDAVLTLTPATVTADVSGARSLPAPPAGAPSVADVVAKVAAIEAALNKCFAAVPANRFVVDPGGNSMTAQAACTDLGNSFANDTDYLQSSYNAFENYNAIGLDPAMTGAAWRVEIEAFRKGDDGNDYVTLAWRFTRADGLTGNRVDVIRKFATPMAGQPTGWVISGNRRAFDATVNAVVNRYLYLSPERPVGAGGVQVDQFNGTSYYESGLRLYFNPNRHANVRSVRITNAVAGTGPLPAAGVVLTRADLANVNTNGCRRDDRMVIANQTGNVNLSSITFRSNNTYVLDRASVDAAKPISKSAWKAYNEYAAVPISAPVPAYTRYKFEVFNVGNTSGVADATFTAPHIAAVPLAASAASYKWAEFSADTLAYIQPGPAKDTLPVAWTLPAGGVNPTSTYSFARLAGGGTARYGSSALVTRPADRSVVMDNLSVAAGCTSGPAFPELAATGFGFRGVGLFLSDARFVRRENGVQWVDQQ